MIDNVIVIAKQPLPGKVKTRLSPLLSADNAAAVAAAALADTLEVVSNTPTRQRLLAFDGDPAGWLPDGWALTRQPPGELDTRLVAAFAASRPGSAVLVGMDTPQLQRGHLESFDSQHFDSCLGPSPDGGYWAIGFRDIAAAPHAIDGIPMSTPETGRLQLARLLALGHRVQLLDELLDVDTVDAAITVAIDAPWTRFAAIVCRLLPIPAAEPS